MKRSSACRLPVFVLLFASAVLGLSSSAAAEEGLSWAASIIGGSASLVYGLPESDYVLLSLDCESRNSPITLAFPYEPDDAKDGAAYSLTVSSGSRALTVETTGSRMEMDDLFILVGDLPRDSDIGGVLSGSGSLAITVGTDVTELPLQTMGTAAREFLAVCSP